MMKKLAFIFGLLLSTATLHAQQSIETRLCFADSTKFLFSGEWQYLSTDIYLFNGNKFNNVINELSFSTRNSERKRRKKGLAEERLEYLYITAQLLNVKFFGDAKVTYPLYNFRISNNKDDKYEMYVSDNIESIRIIDNLPLYSASDKIDAKIDVNAITQNDQDKILGFLGAQLRGLADLSHPTSAILSLVGEIGSFIESNSKKKEYKFSSTIRLFEQKNFDTRLHSLKVYALVSPNSAPIQLNSQSLHAFLDTCKNTQLSRPLLEKLVGYQQYPIIVVANYKSLYRMQSINGDEISFASIDRRKLTIENNFRDKLISEETYRQEKDFIDFLTAYANFKSKLELYTLNARMGNADAAMNALGITMEYYNTLLQEYERIGYKYKANKTYENIFRSEYTSVLDFAAYYLEGDMNLRASKSMLATMRNLNTKGLPTVAADMETSLGKLRFIDNMGSDFKQRAKEGLNICVLVKQLEDKLLAQSFSKDIAELSTASLSGNKVEPMLRLKEKVGTTSCRQCREQAAAAIKDYNTRAETFQRNEVLKLHSSLAKQTELNLISLAEQAQLASSNLHRLYPDSTCIQYNTYNHRLLEIHRDIDNLRGYITFDVEGKPAELITSVNEKIQQTANSIADGIRSLKANKPELFQAPTISEVESKPSGEATPVVANQE